MLTPVFISSIKVYVNMLEAESPSASDSRDNRNYTCQCIYAEIEEIIRVLQLTSADEEDLDTDDAALMRRALVCSKEMLNLSLIYGLVYLLLVPEARFVGNFCQPFVKD